jgi:L-threonylcarbamoyladenylate synthase
MDRPRIANYDVCCLEVLAAEAAEALAAGELVVFPTDTVYGLAARADRQSVVRRIFAAKRRPAERPLPLLLADAAHLDQAARDVPPAARALADAFWPGPLTLVVPRSDRVPLWVTAGEDTVGVRVPDHPLARAILRMAPFLVAVTSANMSDEPAPATAAECAASLAEPPALVLEAGPLPGTASTVVEVTSAGVRVLRPGPVTAEQIDDVLRRSSNA